MVGVQTSDWNCVKRKRGLVIRFWNFRVSAISLTWFFDDNIQVRLQWITALAIQKVSSQIFWSISSREFNNLV